MPVTFRCLITGSNSLEQRLDRLKLACLNFKHMYMYTVYVHMNLIAYIHKAMQINFKMWCIQLCTVHSKLIHVTYKTGLALASHLDLKTCPSSHITHFDKPESPIKPHIGSNTLPLFISCSIFSTFRVLSLLNLSSLVHTNTKQFSETSF